MLTRAAGDALSGFRIRHERAKGTRERCARAERAVMAGPAVARANGAGEVGRRAKRARGTHVQAAREVLGWQDERRGRRPPAELAQNGGLDFDDDHAERVAPASKEAVATQHGGAP